MRVPRRLKVGREGEGGEGCVCKRAFCRWNWFLTVEPASSSSSSSFQITAILSFLRWVSPFLSPLPASFYRAGRGIASAKIAAAECAPERVCMCVRISYDFNAPRRRIGRSPSDRGVSPWRPNCRRSRRKREAEATCQKLRRDYGRRNIVADAAVARACCAEPSMQIAGECFGVYEYMCVTVVVTNSAIDEREVILFCRKLELLNIENSGARKVGYFCSSENFPSSASAKVRSCKTENFQVGNIFRYFEGRWFYTRERFRTVKYFGFSRARIEFRSRENLRNDKNFASRRQQSWIPQMISFRDPQEILRHTSFSPRHIFNKPT